MGAGGRGVRKCTIIRTTPLGVGLENAEKLDFFTVLYGTQCTAIGHHNSIRGKLFTLHETSRYAKVGILVSL